jgi:hypothetical protein
MLGSLPRLKMCSENSYLLSSLNKTLSAPINIFAFHANLYDLLYFDWFWVSDGKVSAGFVFVYSELVVFP